MVSGGLFYDSPVDVKAIITLKDFYIDCFYIFYIIEVTTPTELEGIVFLGRCY